MCVYSSSSELPSDVNIATAVKLSTCPLGVYASHISVEYLHQVRKNTYTYTNTYIYKYKYTRAHNVHPPTGFFQRELARERRVVTVASTESEKSNREKIN